MSVSGTESRTTGLKYILQFTLFVCTMLSQIPAQAHPALDMLSRFFENPDSKSDFKQYMQSPLRQKLSSEHNTAVESPTADDASNWSGCQVGKGVLAGTFRDISACAVSACYGRDVTIEEMKNFSYKEAEAVINWIWNQIGGSKIPDQSVANLTMHIQMQYGNIRIVQAALNNMGAKLRLSGRMDRKTQQALVKYCKEDAADTFNQIRNQLLNAYKRLRGTHLYVRIINKEYPPKISLKRWYNDFLETSWNSVGLFYAAFLPKVERAVKVFWA